MKKIAVIMAIVLSMVLTGCIIREDKDLTSVNLARVAFETEGEVKIIQDRIRDEDFWDSVYRAADLIEDTIDECKLTSVSFKLKTDEGETIILEDIYSFRMVDSDDVWKMLVVNQILYALVTSDEVIKAESSFVHLTVESVILKWSTPGLDEKRTVSVCDVENDGKWDYLSEGRMYFTIAEGATIVMG